MDDICLIRVSFTSRYQFQHAFCIIYLKKKLKIQKNVIESHTLFRAYKRCIKVCMGEGEVISLKFQ